MFKLVAIALAAAQICAVSANSVEEEHSVERRLPAPCDCYVDLGGEYSYINMWKGYPCSGNSLGALYEGRCLYYANTDYYDGPQYVRDAKCSGNYWTYYKMKTASGKSVGWVASEFMDCNYDPNDYDKPPAPAAAAAKLPSADSEDDSP